MNKKNFILGGIFIVLAIAAYIYSGPYRNWRVNLDKTDNFLSGVDVDSITAMTINQAGKETVLEKDGDRWKIGSTKDFYATDDKISKALSALKDAAGAEMTLVSKNEAAKPQFQTDEATGVKLTLSDAGEEVENFIIGKLSGDFTSTYLSPEGAAETYACAANISSAFSGGDWYDKTIFSSDKTKIDQIRFQYQAREFTITGTADEDAATATKKWVGTSPYKFRVSADKIAPILDIMSKLTAVAVPKQTFDGTGLEKHNIIIEATGDGVSNILMIGDDNGDEQYYAKKGDSDNIYLITKEQRDTLDKTSMDLR